MTCGGNDLYSLPSLSPLSNHAGCCGLFWFDLNVLTLLSATPHIHKDNTHFLHCFGILVACFSWVVICLGSPFVANVVGLLFFLWFYRFSTLYTWCALESCCLHFTLIILMFTIKDRLLFLNFICWHIYSMIVFVGFLLFCLFVFQ